MSLTDEVVLEDRWGAKPGRAFWAERTAGQTLWHV